MRTKPSLFEVYTIRGGRRHPLGKATENEAARYVRLFRRNAVAGVTVHIRPAGKAVRKLSTVEN